MKPTDFISEMTPAQQTRREAQRENGQERLKLERAYNAAKAAGDIPRAEQIKKKITSLAAMNMMMDEGAGGTVHPNAKIIKTKKGREVGEIYEEPGNEYPWGCFHYGLDEYADNMETREEAFDQLQELHQAYVQNKSGFTKNAAPFREDTSNDGDWGTTPFEAHGIKGMKRTPWRKTFKNGKQAAAWCEKFDAEILGTRDIEASKQGNLSPAFVHEGFKKVSSQSQERVSKDRAGMRIKTPDGIGIIIAEYKVPTFSRDVPFVHTVRVKFENSEGLTKEYRMKECRVEKVKSDFNAQTRAFNASKNARVNEDDDAVDQICMTVPLFIRCLEWAKENAPDDVALHKFTENAVGMEGCLDVDAYDSLVPEGDMAEGINEEPLEEISDMAKYRLLKGRIEQRGPDGSPSDKKATRTKLAIGRSAERKAGSPRPDSYGVDRFRDIVATNTKRSSMSEDCSAGATCSASVSSGVVGAIPGKKIKRESAPAQAKKKPVKRAPAGKEYTAHGRLVNKPKKDQDQAKNYTGNFGESEMIKRSAIGEGCSQAVNEISDETVTNYRQKAIWDANTAGLHGDRPRALKRHAGLANAKKRIGPEKPFVDNSDRGYGKGRYMGDSIDPNLTELDNGPGGRVKTDKINYDARRNSSGGEVPADELSKRKERESYKKKQDAALRRNGTRQQEHQWRLQDAREEQIELGDNFKFDELKRIASEYAGAHDIIDVVEKRQYYKIIDGVRVAALSVGVYCDYDLNDMGYDQETIDKHGQDGHTSDMITLKFARDPNKPGKIIFTGFGY